MSEYKWRGLTPEEVNKKLIEADERIAVALYALQATVEGEPEINGLAAGDVLRDGAILILLDARDMIAEVYRDIGWA